MATRNTERSAYFPAIEKKYGEPMQFWFDQLAQISDWKYPDQIAFLKENFGFSQAHANALVMYSRGSTSSRRFSSFDDYLKPFDAAKQKTMRDIFKAITDKYTSAELVIAWNQPMIRIGGKYVFGASVQKNHILIAPWGKGVIAAFADRLAGFEVNKKTIRVPADWKVNKKLIHDLVRAAIAASKQE